MFSFRIKIGMGVTFLVIALVMACYLALVGPQAKKGETALRASVERGTEIVQRSLKLRSYELVALSRTAAGRATFIGAVREEDPKKRRPAVFDAIQQFDKTLREKNRKADFFAVLDADGKVIARDLDINALYGEELPLPGIKTALAGTGTSATWFQKGKMRRAACSPILYQGQVAGVVVIAYDLTSADALADHERVGAHVGFFGPKGLRGSSFTKTEGGKVEDESSVTALATAILGKDGPAAKALASGKVSDLFSLKVGGETFLAKIGPMPKATTLSAVGFRSGENGEKDLAGETRSGFVVLASVDKSKAPVSAIRWILFLMLIISVIFVLGTMNIVARHFVTAEDKLELGVAEVINGNMDYTFDTLQEFEGLANALNVMLARLLGRPEPGEDEEGGGYDPSVLQFLELTTEVAADQLAELVAVDTDTHLNQLVVAYLDELKRYNYSTEGLGVDSILQKLKANQAMLTAKHKCESIRFVVTTTPEGEIAFQPIKVA
jgi:hypothetical protein